METRIGVAQTRISNLGIEENLQRAKSFVKRANKEKCEIICFPELFLTGPLKENIPKYAQSIPGSFTEAFCNLAKKNDLHIVMGTIIEKEGERYYNTSVLINNLGEILGKYRKIKLWNGEKKHLARGNEMPVFDTKFGKVGLQICWDLAFPEITKQLMLKGARMIFCPAYWTSGDKHIMVTTPEMRSKIPEVDAESTFVNTCVPARAIESEVVFVFANGWEGFTADRLVGHSQIAIPYYGTVRKAEDEETLLITDVDIELTELAEESYQIRKDS